MAGCFEKVRNSAEQRTRADDKEYYAEEQLSVQEAKQSLQATAGELNNDRKHF
jgi:hypothetical protein